MTVDTAVSFLPPQEEKFSVASYKSHQIENLIALYCWFMEQRINHSTVGKTNRSIAQMKTTQDAKSTVLRIILVVKSFKTKNSVILKLTTLFSISSLFSKE